MSAAERTPRRSSGGVVQRQTSNGVVFALRYRAGGRRWYETTDARTAEEAKRRLDATLELVRQGRWEPPQPQVEAKRDPTLHEFADEWYERHRLEVGTRAAEHAAWTLSHVLGVLGEVRLSRITVERVDAYRTAKVRERERLEAALAAWRDADPETRGPRPPRGLGNASINRTLRSLAAVLDLAVEYDLIDSNPARGKKRRLRARKPKRYWLDLDEVQSLLDAAGAHRALLATMVCTGLRVGELCSLRWRAVNIATAKLTVEESKTEAGEDRVVEIVPLLLDELKAWRADHKDAGDDDLVFPTRTGTMRDRHNVRSRVLLPALARANKARTDAGMRAIAHVTNHTLRRTFCSLLYDAGASPAEVMDQLGHENAALALEMYTKKTKRDRGTAARMDALLRDGWALAGTEASDPAEASPGLATEGARNPLG